MLNYNIKIASAKGRKYSSLEPALERLCRTKSVELKYRETLRLHRIIKNRIIKILENSKKYSDIGSPTQLSPASHIAQYKEPLSDNDQHLLDVTVE